LEGVPRRGARLMERLFPMAAFTFGELAMGYPIPGLQPDTKEWR